ncbi:MAG: hypothetical protein C4344_00005 [Acidimicrobiia bacterium]
MRYSHTGQVVRDLARSEHFYAGALGFEKVFELTVEGDQPARLLRLPGEVRMRAVYLRRDGLVLELMEFATPALVEPDRTPVMNEPGLTHISLVVDDLDAACAAVEAHGGRVLADTRLPTAVFVQDPDAQLVELLGPEARMPFVPDASGP